MSLQLAAQHLASRGRGPDTTLVHMAPQEVAGLQALAKAHGGTLTVNPDTGLPEAGFLSSILPTVIGAGLSIASGGALTPLMAAGITGAGYGIATGSLQRGLMAGLGAYGGAGLAGGLTAAGAAAGAAETGLTAAGGVMGTNPMVVQPMTFGAETLGAEALGAAAPSVGVGSAQGINAMDAMSDMAARQAGMGPTTQALTAGAPQVATATPIPVADRFAQAGKGFQSLMTEEGRNAFLGNAASKGVEATGVGGMKGLAQYGLAGLAPVAMDMMTPKQQAMAEQEKRKAYEYTYSPGRVADPQQGYTGAYTGERTYFNPVYTRTAAGGGLMDIGPVEAMSRTNQSQMTPAYARGGSSDVGVNPYTGAEMFAEGGDTKAVKPVEQDPYYTMTGQSGDAFKYLMGQGPKPMTAMPAPAAVVPVQSTVQPVAPETGGAMGLVKRMMGNTIFGAPFGQQPGQGGEYVDADTNIKPYSFDPATGTFTAVAPKKVYRPYEGDGGPMQPYFNPNITPWDMGGTGMAQGGIASLAQGGQSHLGDYSDGGRLLRGPGDGVSDDIPATIGDKRPARLADGEFVVPARIVSELGNGSTEAGARKLYAMMDRVQRARGKTVGKDRVAVNTKAEKMLPA